MIGSALNSLRAQRRLSDATGEVSRAYERLASGARINRASDDAAGLSIADSLRSKARLYGAAIRNTNDGLSMLNIVDSTLDQQISIIGRLQELAEQSANGTLSSAQRRTLSSEYQALLNESGRLADASSFNGRALLSGAADKEKLLLQVGLDGGAGSRIGIDLASTGRLSGSLSIATLSRRDSSLDGDDASDVIEYLNGNYLNLIAPIDYVAYTKSSTGQDVAVVASAISDNGDNYEVVFSLAMRSSSGSWGFYTVNGGQYGVSIRFDKVTGQMIDSPGDSDSFGYTLSNSESQVNLDLTSASVYLDFRGLSLTNSSVGSAIGFTGVATVDGSRAALDSLGARLTELNELRGRFGALGSRLGVTLNLLGVSGDVTKQAEGRIRDTDIAGETSRLLLSQLKQQAAASVLAQANQDGQLVLQLLRG